MMSPLAVQIIEIAASQVGVRETGRNRGPMVDEYLRAAGLNPALDSYPWCASFAVWVVRQACLELGIPNPLPRTSGVHKLWMRSPPHTCVQRPSPGAIFCIDHGGGKGHCGFVEEVGGTHLVTIEGNTNDGGSREGDGVYRRSRRFDEVNLGYIDLSRKPPEPVT